MKYWMANMLLLLWIPLKMVWNQWDLSKILKRLEKNPDDENRSHEMIRFNKVSILFYFFVFASSMCTFFFIEKNSRNINYIFLFICMVSIIVIDALAIKKIRAIQSSNSRTIAILMRVLLGMAIFYGLYFALVHLSEILALNSEHQTVVMVVGVFLALCTVAFCAPLILRLMFPCQALPKGPIREQLEALFKKAKLPLPQFWVIELDDQKFHNALVSGLGWAPKPFGRSVFISQNLMEKLLPEELSAIIAHEMAHIYFKHIPKRLFWSFLYDIIVFAFFIFLFSALFLLGPHFVVAELVILFLSGYFFSGRLVRMQEIEADAAAVTVLGANPQALISGLEKLTILNHAKIKKKGLFEHISSLTGHPPLDERKSYILRSAKRYEQGHGLLKPWDYVSDFFSKSRVAFTIIFFIIFVSIPSHIAMKKPYVPFLTYGMIMKSSPAIRIAVTLGLDLNQEKIFQNMTILPVAITYFDFETMKMLIDQGADPMGTHEVFGHYLNLSLFVGNLEKVQYFLNLGIDPKKAAGRNKIPAIFHAVKSKNVEVVKLLLEKGIDINTPHPQHLSTSLWVSIADGQLEMTRFLIEHGAEVNVKNIKGSTPLYVALIVKDSKHKADIVKLLMEKGADTTVKGAKGENLKELLSLLEKNSRDSHKEKRLPASE